MSDIIQQLTEAIASIDENDPSAASVYREDLCDARAALMGRDVAAERRGECEHGTSDRHFCLHCHNDRAKRILQMRAHLECESWLQKTPCRAGPCRCANAVNDQITRLRNVLADLLKDADVTMPAGKHPQQMATRARARARKILEETR